MNLEELPASLQTSKIERFVTTVKGFAKIQKQPPEVLYKKALLKIFAIFTGKPLLNSLFDKVAGLQACNFIKKRL